MSINSAKTVAPETQSKESTRSEYKPTLGMIFHKKSGRYFIRNGDNDTLQFPTEKRIYEIWHAQFPNTNFFIGSSIEKPVIGFYADVGTGTKPKERQKFCEALAAECVFAERTS